MEIEKERQTHIYTQRESERESEMEGGRKMEIHKERKR